MSDMASRRPESELQLVAQLATEAMSRALWRSIGSGAPETASAALRELAAGRTDLLAEVAGVLEGETEGGEDEERGRYAAELCNLAGAAEDAIPAWIEEGRRRRNAPRIARGFDGCLKSEDEWAWLYQQTWQGPPDSAQ